MGSCVEAALASCGDINSELSCGGNPKLTLAVLDVPFTESWFVIATTAAFVGDTGEQDAASQNLCKKVGVQKLMDVLTNLCDAKEKNGYADDARCVTGGERHFRCCDGLGVVGIEWDVLDAG